jgi:hypothetical protein
VKTLNQVQCKEVSTRFLKKEKHVLRAMWMFICNKAAFESRMFNDFGLIRVPLQSSKTAKQSKEKQSG